MTTLGENYVQECAAKDRWLRGAGVTPSWHLLGHLQRNKVRRAVGLFDLLESVDSLELAQLLSQARVGQGSARVLCEVELTGLPGRTGFAPERLERELSQLVGLPGIQVEGLMTVAARERAGPTFAACRILAERLSRLSGHPLATLSMGMSGDFEAAIAEGSTQVRIGQLLFGSRLLATG